MEVAGKPFYIELSPGEYTWVPRSGVAVGLIYDKYDIELCNSVMSELRKKAEKGLPEGTEVKVTYQTIQKAIAHKLLLEPVICVINGKECAPMSKSAARRYFAKPRNKQVSYNTFEKWYDKKPGKYIVPAEYWPENNVDPPVICVVGNVNIPFDTKSAARRYFAKHSTDEVPQQTFKKWYCKETNRYIVPAETIYWIDGEAFKTLGEAAKARGVHLSTIHNWIKSPNKPDCYKEGCKTSV